MNRNKILENINKIIFKVGTSTLTYPNGKLNYNRINKLSRVLTDLRNQGKQVVLVSSGSIVVGNEILGLSKRSSILPEVQAAAAIGQAVLMNIYNKSFSEYQQTIAQILLTKDVIDHSIRQINAKNTFNTLLDMGIIPIVNENDTIATDEIEFGDNDTLSATVATLVDADLLILLSDIDGLYTQDPRKDPSAKIISVVDNIDKNIESIATDSGSSFGTGGMITKISAAKLCLQSDIPTIITNGENPDIIYKILSGENIGTLFINYNN